MMKDSKKIADSPIGPPEGAFGATEGGPIGGGCDPITTPDPEVDPQKRRRKLTAKYKLRILQERLNNVEIPSRLAASCAGRAFTHPA